MNDRPEPARALPRPVIDPMERTSESTPGGSAPLPFHAVPQPSMLAPLEPSAPPAPRSPFASSFGLAALSSTPPKPVAVAIPLNARIASDVAAEQVRKEARPEARSEKSAAAGVERRALVDILHHDDDLGDRIARDAHFRSSLSGPRDLVAANDKRGHDCRRRVLTLLSTADAVDPSTVRATSEVRLADPTLFELPLLVVEGDLRPTFEEAEVLRLTIAAAQPHAPRDRHLAELVKLATDLSASSWPPAGDAATNLAKQIEQSTHHLGLPVRYVANQVERALLVGRHFKKRPLFGGEYLRLELSTGRGDAAIPVYVPETAASKLPLLPVFTARLVAELRPREDANEANAEALVALALSRRLDAAKRSYP